MIENDGAPAISEDDTPDQIFHYTSLDTMMKIVDSRSIWATAIPYLNDSGERQFVLDAVQQRLPVLKQKAGTLINPKLGLQVIDVQDADSLTSFAEETFVACFAEHSDSLMHWRAYCPQESGVAIGFDTGCLKAARLNKPSQAGMVVSPVSVGRVSYLDPKDTTQLDRLILRAYKIATEDFEGTDSWAPLNQYFRWALDSIACMHKRKAFEVEDEVRLVLPSIYHREKENLMFRTVRSTIIPYVSMAIPTRTDTRPIFNYDEKNIWSAIRSVRIGPTANMVLTERSVKAFFDKRRMNVQVLPSDIPYRDW